MLTVEKDLGRKLRGKKMAAISCSNGNHLGDQFWLPFSKSAKYLGMDYLVDLHTISGVDNTPKIRNFVAKIDAHKSSQIS